MWRRSVLPCSDTAHDCKPYTPIYMLNVTSVYGILIPNMRAVYTAITNGYDTLKPQPVADGVDFICFTDDKTLQPVEPWVIKYEKDIDHKQPKILRYMFMPQYDQTLWIDANVVLKDGFESIFDELKSNHIATFNAKLWNSVRREAKECVAAGYETETKADTLITFLESEGYIDDKLSNCTVILRDNDPTLAVLESRWFNCIKHFSRRDQLSMNYVLWKTGVEQDYIEGSIYENKYLTWLQNHG